MGSPEYHIWPAILGIQWHQQQQLSRLPSGLKLLSHTQALMSYNGHTYKHMPTVSSRMTFYSVSGGVYCGNIGSTLVLTMDAKVPSLTTERRTPQ